jgi:Zn-dependent protease with chaperone function
MSISTFFSSVVGMYVTQSFVHSLIASIITGQAINAWQIDDPVVRQRFRFLVLLFPIFSYPFYQVLNPDRGSPIFRLNVLFDSSRWLNMDLWGVVPVNLLFLLLLAIVSLVFLFQEMIPILRHSLESRTATHEGTHRDTDSFIQNASKTLAIETPEAIIVDDDELIIFSTPGKNSVIVWSTGLSEALTPDQMQAALAHELAHISRSRRPILLAVFLLRMIMFFNPVSLVEFRRAIRNEEKICDDIAVSLTHRPDALVEALKKFYAVCETPVPDAQQKPWFTPVRLEEHSYNMQLDTRITRLEQDAPREADGRWFLMLSLLLIIASINYFVI